jgi:zinc transport system substrate-binding protein
MNKKGIAIGVVILLVAGIAGAIMLRQQAVNQSAQQSAQGKLSVAASFYPMAFLAAEIGGEKVDVLNVTPVGAEPHEYEPTPQDMAKIEKSQLVILNGGKLEAWGDNVMQNIDPKRTTLVVAGEGLTTKQVEEGGETITDPHVWLAPFLMEKMADRVMAGFVTADPVNAVYYRDRAAVLQKKLHDTDMAFRQGLADCAKKDIITSHAAFGYLAASYGLKQVSITGISTDGEPSSQQLADIAKFAEDNSVKYIFFESLVSPKLADTIANEVGAQTLVLNPIEGLSNEELAQEKNYLTEMMSNLVNLETALQCNR